MRATTDGDHASAARRFFWTPVPSSPQRMGLHGDCTSAARLRTSCCGSSVCSAWQGLSTRAQSQVWQTGPFGCRRCSGRWPRPRLARWPLRTPSTSPSSLRGSLSAGTICAGPRSSSPRWWCAYSLARAATARATARATGRATAGAVSPLRALTGPPSARRSAPSTSSLPFGS